MLDVRSFCFKMVGPTHPAIALNTQGRREISVKNSASCNTAKSLGSMPSSVPDARVYSWIAQGSTFDPVLASGFIVQGSGFGLGV